LYISRQNVKQIKNMKTIALSLFCFFAFNSMSQNLKTSAKNLKKETNSNIQKQDSTKVLREYLWHPDKLKLGFVSGEIPYDFPKYNNDLDYKSNSEIAKSWAKLNKNLIKQEYWSKFDY